MKESAQKRDNFIDEQVVLAGGAEESLDYKIYDAVREQAARIGLRYEGGPAH